MKKYSLSYGKAHIHKTWTSECCIQIGSLGQHVGTVKIFLVYQKRKILSVVFKKRPRSRQLNAELVCLKKNLHFTKDMF